ncbi:DUF4367 domain-containing protein [Paenibacillus larvae]|uniref:Uncharacterized protein n=1 Tax=Paenibacillus larvae subsp. larvae TaxID=147375 RepID=A0A6C0QZJ5_9BACL|nr:DUF4367 domain-containing protein [Paenibacillus larvae]QHZ54155.1 hypothetical protein ERICV_05171 [Paenibacillus larvae subsp. larvae]
MLLVRLIIATVTLSCILFNPVTYAEKPTQQVQEFENNEISLSDGVSNFEKKTKKKVLLPKYLPFDSTDQTVNFNKEGKLRVRYCNEKTKQNLIVSQEAVSYPVRFSNKNESILKDGTKAYYYNDDVVHHIVFRREDVVYSIIAFKKNNELTQEQLIKVANSLSDTGYIGK